MKRTRKVRLLKRLRQVDEDAFWQLCNRGSPPPTYETSVRNPQCGPGTWIKVEIS
jgi:hypothetical protein